MPQSSGLVIGIDIGASKTLAGLVTRAGEIAHSRQVSTEASPTAILAATQALIAVLIEEADEPVHGIGIGSAGIVHAPKGIILHANDNLPGWTGTDLSALGIVSGLPIIVENDARAMSHGEARLGAGREYRSLLCVTVGTGIGGAIIIDGEIWHGANYSAGEIGYLVVGWDSGEPLMLDQFASGPAIERAYQAAAESDRRLPLTKISRRAIDGDELALRVIQAKARQLGIILAGYVASINPEAVVLGGGVPQIGALWWDAFTAGFQETAPPLLKKTPLLPAALGVEATMLGAAMLAWRSLGR